MSNHANIKSAYDTVAGDYAAKFWNEFENKHFDRIMLGWYASQIRSDQTVLEIGAGPGEVSGYLSKLGVRCVGTDASHKMIECARQLFPDVEFAVKDFFDLSYGDESFYAGVAYYAIVNYPLAEIGAILREVHRVLKRAGLFLFTFHVFEAEPQITVRTFLDKDIDEITFYFFKIDQVKELVESIGFGVVDVLLRYPYPGVEFGSKRAYFLLRKP